MAKQTLTVQLMHAQARIAELETAHGLLRVEYNARVSELEERTAQLDALRAQRPAQPAWRAAAEQRRRAAAAFFAANPNARSVTDAQLREFSEAPEVAHV